MVRYNKLVRDKIAEILVKEQKVPRTHVASDSEYEQKLKEKLQEEVDEFIESDSSDELVDILEVLHALAELQNIYPQQLELIRKEKEQKRGKFSRRLILDEVMP